MRNIILIFMGAGFGGVIRYWMSNAVHWLIGRQFPYGTLVVNISGSFIMGLVFALLLERFDGLGGQLRALLLIGFLGGYTTFSTFSMETIIMFENGAWLNGFFNILVSVVFCLIATWLGVIGGRQL